MICKHCGIQLPDGVLFCRVCGNRQPTQEAAPIATESVRQEQPSEKTEVVRQELPVAPPAPAPVTPPVRPARKKLPVKGIAITLAAAILAGASAFLPYLGGGSTVYLLTEHTQSSSALNITQQFDYDEAGRLVYCAHEIESPNDSFEISMAWSYEYDDEGQLIEAEYEDDDISFSLEYEYDKDGNLKSVEDRDQEIDVECDDEGRITWIQVEGDLYLEAEYSYFENGRLEEMEYRKNDGHYVFAYDENGVLLEYTSFRSNGSRLVCGFEYDDEGKLLEESEIIYTEEDEVYNETIITYGYDREGNWVSYAIEFNFRNEGLRLNAEFEVTGDEREKRVRITEITGDRQATHYLEDMEEGDTYMRLKYDEMGNCVERVTYDDVRIKETFTYEPFQVPRDYVLHDVTDPIYFILLSTRETAFLVW